jgi:hypothetical protein
VFFRKFLFRVALATVVAGSFVDSGSALGGWLFLPIGALAGVSACAVPEIAEEQDLLADAPVLTSHLNGVCQMGTRFLLPGRDLD